VTVSERPKVKICCISSRAEARLAIQYGADALGFVSAMPSGPGVTPEARIAEMVIHVPSPIETFLLTAETDPPTVETQVARCGVTTLQLCDRVPAAALAALRSRLVSVRLVQAIHVTGPDAAAEAREVSPLVDAILLDSGRPNNRVKELGGTGRVHDWGISQAIVAEVRVPVFLAGGLTPTNVADALHTVRPYGVDVCSGVRTHGRLDEAKLRAFVEAVEASAAEAGET